MNFTEIIKNAANNLSWFDKKDRTAENALIQIQKVLECNSNEEENAYCCKNIDFAIHQVLQKANPK